MLNLITVFSSLFLSVNSDIIKGSFWEPSEGNSCGFREPS